MKNYKYFSFLLAFCLIVLNGKLFSQNTENQNITIQNKFLKVQISKEGAELKSIKSLKTNNEILWQGNPEYWAQTSPVLFPTIGKSWNEEIHVNGKAFPIKTHGFASYKSFQLYKKSKKEAWFLLKDDDETFKIYPYKFEFYIGFILKKNQLETRWKVINKDTKEMAFQIGGHTGFQMPDFDKNAENLGYIKLISDKNPIQFMVKEAGRYFTENPTIHQFTPDSDGFFSLSKKFFKDDAVVFENYQAKEIQLFDKNKKPIASVKTKTPVFALWTANQFAPFVCIEPWFGRADTKDFKGDISEKKWAQKLKPNEIFTSGYSIEVLK